MRTEYRPIDLEIAYLAERQYGVVALWQLVALGLAAATVRGRVAAGRLHPIHRGVYAVGHKRLTKSGRWMAAVLACGEGAVLSHISAGELLGIANGRGIHVASPTRSRNGIPGVILHHPSGLRDDERTEVDHIPCTSVTRTLVDLATIFDAQQIKRAWQDAQRQGLLDVTAVRPYLDQPRKGIANLRALVELQEDVPDTKTEFEHRFHDLMRANPDIPQPVYNVALHGYVVDAAWLKQRLIVELDSRGFHWHRAEEDYDRDAELLTHGFRTYRVTWRALTREPDKVATRLRRLLRTAPSPTRAARADGA
jgi:hypothetical protein